MNVAAEIAAVTAKNKAKKKTKAQSAEEYVTMAPILSCTCHSTSNPRENIACVGFVFCFATAAS